MTEHLPECPHSEPALSPGFLVMCICDRLRACEQRVLDAAREAVEQEWTEDPSWNGTNWNNALTVALDAIDALRLKP